MERICVGCGGSKEIHAKNLCYYCYRKQWVAPKIICKNCNKERPHHAFGLCNQCHMKLNHYDSIKSHNVRKYHNISYEQYKDLLKGCILCGFDSVVDLHHFDKNRKNNSPSNLISLCPNHHKMVHNQKFSKKIEEEIRKKLNL